MLSHPVWARVLLMKAITIRIQEERKMSEFECQWQHHGRTITFSWVGEADVVVSRVYALAFTSDRKLLLVGGGPGDPGFWLPGGGIEEGETPEEALARELAEEAAAAIHAMARLGAQRVDDPAAGTEYHDFYWCRVTLADEFVPVHEVKLRRLVTPEEFLDILFWGRDDPKAAMLLDRALEIDRRHPVISD